MSIIKDAQDKAFTKSSLGIIDFSHIYYKYKFANNTGSLKPLSDDEGKDITVLYHSLRDILYKAVKHDKAVICIDSKSNKNKNEDGTDNGYKSNRTSKLNDGDFLIMSRIKNMLESIGYTAYKLDEIKKNKDEIIAPYEKGFEADDLIGYACKNYNSIDKVIYTNDYDLVQLVDERTSVNIYSTKKVNGSKNLVINMSNYEEELSKKYKTDIKYGMLKAYKSLCGDTSDNICGVKKFGKVAYNKWFEWLKQKNEELDYSKDENLELVFKEYFKDGEKLEQAITSLKLVSLRVSDIEERQEKTKELKEINNSITLDKIKILKDKQMPSLYNLMVKNIK